MEHVLVGRWNGPNILIYQNQIEDGSLTLHLSLSVSFQFDRSSETLQLIDIGKVIHVTSLNDHKIYNLTQEAKLTPIRAKLCKIKKVINALPFD